MAAHALSLVSLCRALARWIDRDPRRTTPRANASAPCAHSTTRSALEDARVGDGYFDCARQQERRVNRQDDDIIQRRMMTDRRELTGGRHTEEARSRLETYATKQPSRLGSLELQLKSWLAWKLDQVGQRDKSIQISSFVSFLVFSSLCSLFCLTSRLLHYQIL